MDEVQFKKDEHGHGMFYIMEEDEKWGEMVVEIKENIMTVFHTEVLEKAEGKGYAKKLLAAMVQYARQANLKVIALCPYVHLQFRRHSDEYADIWVKDSPEHKTE